jgi:glycosyltransferase involved in cell wall biosynthesis
MPDFAVALARRRATTLAQTPMVSVCIPVYNGADSIGRSIDSVLAQTYTNFECVVVDNNSSDATIARVQAYSDPRIRFVRNRTNLGLVGNHNRCLVAARGQLIQFVHADDWLLPDCLENLVPMFDHDNVGLAFAPRRVVTPDQAWKARYGRLEGTLRPLHRLNSGAELIRRYLAAGADGNPIGEPTSVMLRRETILAVGGFRPDVPQLQDIDAWLRMLTCCDAAFIDEELTVRWHHAGTATETFGGTAALDQMWVLCDLIRSKDLGMPLRLRALWLWSKALARSPMTVLATPSGQRVTRARSFAAHTRHLFATKTLPFEWDTHHG